MEPDWLNGSIRDVVFSTLLPSTWDFPQKPPPGTFCRPKLFLTNFCANGSKPRNTGVVGELVTPRYHSAELSLPRSAFSRGARKSAGTNFCANGSKPRNTGVVGTVGGPLVPTTPSDQGLLHFPKRWISPRSQFSRVTFPHTQPTVRSGQQSRRPTRQQSIPPPDTKPWESKIFTVPARKNLFGRCGVIIFCSTIRTHARTRTHAHAHTRTHAHALCPLGTLSKHSVNSRLVPDSLGFPTP